MPKLMDLVGQKFGELTVIKRAPSQKKQTMWECQCSCGATSVVASSNLRHGTTKSCGCKKWEVIANKLTKNEVGNRFGRLVALEQIRQPIIKNGKKDGNYVKYRCLCDCGRETIVWGAHLRRGDIVSCGCFGKEQLKTINITHGLSYTKEYNRFKANRYDERKKLYDTEWTVEMEQLLRSMFTSCCICGMTQEQHIEKYGESLNIDHVLPLSKGNGLKPGNTVILCKFHNDSKRAKSLNNLPLDWQAAIIWNAFKFKDAWQKSMEHVYDNLSR